MRRARVLGSGIGLVLALALAAGCSLLGREETEEVLGYSIKLRIQAPPAGKGITVGELDVSGLHIEVLDQAEVALASFDWAAGEGSQEYSVQVPQPGEYRIVVTHLGGSEEDPVQATEEAVFEIRAMKITVIDVVPGGIGLIWVEGQTLVDVTGYWDLLLVPGPPQPGPIYVCMTQDGTHLDAVFWGGGLFVGTVEGDHLVMQGDPGGGFDIVLDGTVSGGQIAGTVALPGSEEEGTFTMTRSALPFGHWDLTGFYQAEELPLFLDTEYGIGALGAPDDPPTHFILYYFDTQLSARLWINVIGEDLEVGRDYALANEAWGGLHWSYHTEEFERDIELTGPGTLHISSYSAEGISGWLSAGLQGGGSISGNFDLSFVEGFD